MMRINLLPPEVLDRRKAERRIGWVVMAAIGVAVVLVGVYALGYFRLQGAEDELASIQQQVQVTNAEAAKLAVFEERATELQTRKTIAALALAERRNWAKLFNEVSLVLPTDIWIQTLVAEEDTGLQLSGFAIDTPADSPDYGHTSMAKMLVRLADLGQLNDVWLTSSQKADFEEQPAIQFTVTASVPATGSDTP